jgi:hypothetical protein
VTPLGPNYLASYAAGVRAGIQAGQFIQPIENKVTTGTLAVFQPILKENSHSVFSANNK